ncbi:MAG: WD40 repeat domain-containing protein [Planctomycetes bacterium]|nr:WD40 repeat domain-containing protein [Planctomycetota bacterium]MBL7040354.1 WD40 repeat domain-containing protein [Pirellulaceae bacterium]
MTSSQFRYFAAALAWAAIVHTTLAGDGQFTVDNGVTDGDAIAQAVSSERGIQKAAEDTKAPRSLSVGAQVYGLAFSPDGHLLATAGKNGVRLWTLASGKQAVPLIEGIIPRPKKIPFWGTPSARSPVFSLDGRLVAAAEYLPCEEGVRDVAAGRYRVWDVASGKLRAKRDFPDPLTTLAFSPDGARLAIGDACNGFGFGEIAGQTIWYQHGESRMAPPTADVAFSPDGAMLAVADDPDEARKYLSGGLHVPAQGEDCTIRLIDATTKKTLHEISAKSSEGLHKLAFAADGKTLYAAYEDGHLRQWNVLSAKLVTSYRIQTEPWYFTPIAFSSDGNWLAVRDRRDGPIVIWDLAVAQKAATIDVSTDSSDILTISFAARLLAVADPDDKEGSVSLWKVAERPLE